MDRIKLIWENRLKNNPRAMIVAGGSILLWHYSCLGFLHSGAPQCPESTVIRGLYEAMLASVIGQAPRANESLPELIERIGTIRRLERDLDTLRARLRKERQFNRKTEINAQIRENEGQLRVLAGDGTGGNET